MSSLIYLLPALVLFSDSFDKPLDSCKALEIERELPQEPIANRVSEVEEREYEFPEELGSAKKAFGGYSLFKSAFPYCAEEVGNLAFGSSLLFLDHLLEEKLPKRLALGARGFLTLFYAFKLNGTHYPAYTTFFYLQAFNFFSRDRFGKDLMPLMLEKTGAKRFVDMIPALPADSKVGRLFAGGSLAIPALSIAAPAA